MSEIDLVTNRQNDIMSVFDDENMEYEYKPDKQLCIVKMNGTNCVELYFDDDARKIIVKSIYKCSSDNVPTSKFVGSGTYIIQKIIELSKQPKYTSYQLIIEHDVSRIVPPETVIRDAKLYLNKLRILSTGKTWYNSMGFYEDCYVYTKDCIQQFIEKTISITYSKKPTDIRTRVLQHRPELQLEIPTRGTVKDVFTSIASDIAKISRTWEKIIIKIQREGGNIDTEIIPEEKELLEKYSNVMKSRYSELEKECNQCKKDDNSNCHLDTKNHFLIYSDVEPIKSTDLALPPNATDFGKGAESLLTTNSEGDRSMSHEKLGKGGISRSRRKKKYNKTRRVHFE